MFQSRLFAIGLLDLNIKYYPFGLDNGPSAIRALRPSGAFRRSAAISGPMRQHVFQPCIPTHALKVPSSPDWLYEIKHDGYRLIVQRDGVRARLFTRRGYDWSDRFPLIVEDASRLRTPFFVMNGEAVILRDDA
jgi:bifunctional non-homologous end joining protein LigD